MQLHFMTGHIWNICSLNKSWSRRVVIYFFFKLIIFGISRSCLSIFMDKRNSDLPELVQVRVKEHDNQYSLDIGHSYLFMNELTKLNIFSPKL